jgi:hypothetical protein
MPIASTVPILDSIYTNNNNANDHLQPDTLVDEVNGIENIDDDLSNNETGGFCENELICYQSKMIHEVKLLKILNDLGTPLYAYSTIMQWAYNANVSQYNFNTKNKTYHQVINHLEKSLDMQSFQPKTLKVQMQGDNKEMDVVVFDVPTLLASLFNDTELNRNENLVVNVNDRFGKYQSIDNRLGEVNSGKWYNMAYTNLIKDPKNNFLCPLILSSDKTTLSDMGDLHVDAIFMTTSIFNTHVREKLN